MSRPALLSLWGMLALGAAGVLAASPRSSGDEAAQVAGGGNPAPASLLEQEVAVRPAGLLLSSAAELTLPPPFTFPASEDSPAPVIFDHLAHVDPAAMRCDECHPRLFRLTEPGRPAVGELDSDRAHEGDLCGGCHDGERAFLYEDDCELCHAGDW